MSAGGKTVEKKASTKNGILRLVLAALAIILEIVFLVGLVMSRMDRYAELVAVITRLLAFFLVLAIYSQNKTPSIKMPWIILILIFPAVGVALYLFIGLSGSTKHMRKRFAEAEEKLRPFLKADTSVSGKLRKEEKVYSGVSCYLEKESGYPLYQNTEVTYYEDAAKGLEAQKEAMRQAKSFIFMEYFAIEDAESWQGVEEILAAKAAEGVEVRVFYDDFGSIGFINTNFARKLEKRGIKCRIFNPMVPLANLFLNNRDHRKMTIIDGRVGFTGGYNLANEYFNLTSPYGHWKDTGIRLEGEAVRAMTVTYLEMWNAVRADDQDDSQFASYLPEENYKKEAEGYVQFYADNPMDKNRSAKMSTSLWPLWRRSICIS